MYKTKAVPIFLWFLLSINAGLVTAGRLQAQSLREVRTEVVWDTLDKRQAGVRQTFFFSEPFSAGDTLWFYDYLHAYASVNSELGKSIAGQYKLEYHFSSLKERGDTYFEPDTAYRIIRNYTEGRFYGNNSRLRRRQPASTLPHAIAQEKIHRIGLRQKRRPFTRIFPATRRGQRKGHVVVCQ